MAPQEPLPISLCMVAAAEAHRIAKALASAVGWTREIVVVINEEVTDGTEEIARGFGARVYREPWKGFVGQKNSVADKATQPWILGLDADEVVSEPLRRELANLFQDPTRMRAHAAFEFPRCTYYCGRWIRHGDWYPDRVTRFWQKGRAVWEGVEPHAYLALRGPLGRLKGDLLHYSNESIDRQIAKIAPYSEYFVRHCQARGRFPNGFDLGIRPVWRFLRAYFFRLGFLDGWPGYYIAWLSAFSTVTRYVKIREAEQRRREQAPVSK